MAPIMHNAIHLTEGEKRRKEERQRKERGNARLAASASQVMRVGRRLGQRLRG